MEKTVDYYMNLPYTLQVIRLEDGSYAGFVKELRGLMIGGDTWAEFGENVEMVKQMWFEAALEIGMDIPEPEPIRS